MLRWLISLFKREPICLTIVRRYIDANGSFVGELYMDGNMIGMSLDTLPFNLVEAGFATWELDTKNDFLAPMPERCVRVGALQPQDNDAVRRLVGNLPPRRIVLTMQNRFIEHVLSGKEK